MFDLSDLQEKNRLFDMLEKKRRFVLSKRPFNKIKQRLDRANLRFIKQILRFDFQPLISAPIGRRPAL